MLVSNQKNRLTAVRNHSACATTAVACVMLVWFASPIQAQDRRSSSQLEALVRTWKGAVVGSQAEREAGGSVHQLVQDVLGAEAERQWRAYQAAPIGLRTVYLDSLQDTAEARGLRWERAQFLLSVDDVLGEYEAATATSAEIDPAAKPEIALASEKTGTETGLDVALTLHASNWEVREALHLEGVLRNESDQLVWVVDSLLQLRLEPQIERAAGAVTPRFPLIPFPTVALAPHADVLVEWTSQSTPATGNVVSRFLRKTLLKPREYRVESRVYYATVDPRNRPLDLTEWESQRTGTPGVLSLDWGLLLLLPTLWFGGVLAVLLQIRQEEPKGFSVAKAKRAGGGIFGTILLTTAVAVLSFFSDRTDLLPSLTMESPGQALAAGVLIQLLGYSYYAKRLPRTAGQVAGDPG